MTPPASPDQPPPAAPASPPGLLRRLDPTVLPILAAALVLLGAVAWLLGRPLPQPGADEAAARLEALSGRIAALEDRAPPDLAPLREAAAAAAARAEAANRQAAALEQRLAARPAIDPAGFAPRPALEDLAGRVEALAREGAATGQQGAQRLAAAEQALAGFAGRVAANEAALAARTQSIETQNARLAAMEQALAARLAALEGQIAQRAQAAEQQAARLAALEGHAQRLAALEGRSARMAALDAVRVALDSGQPLGAALRPLPNPPEALTRFAGTAPPTEAALRLGFEGAARAGRTASEPPAGTGVLDSAVSRLSGMITVRRGEELLWGDAAGAAIERARRALEAGDLDGALGHLTRLSPPAREAMRGWIGQAEALVAARAALRQLAAG
ncbi:hypothetical protein [Falsiroseomonas sp.]|uniref:hypothetical protein n=1 Tax=Falsiroseomonas sp. TaxID=2870721 RepID=UPI0034A20789